MPQNIHQLVTIHISHFWISSHHKQKFIQYRIVQIPNVHLFLHWMKDVLLVSFVFFQQTVGLLQINYFLKFVLTAFYLPFIDIYLFLGKMVHAIKMGWVRPSRPKHIEKKVWLKYCQHRSEGFFHFSL